jgi:pyrroline-5-carboxylate reductase
MSFVRPLGARERETDRMRVAILGAGKIGEALLSGLLRRPDQPDDVCFAEQYPARASEISERYGVASMSAVDATRTADVVVLAVKPPDVAALAAEIGPALRPESLVLSVAAGICTAVIESRLPAGARVVRAMPNTPMLVSEGMAAIAPGAHADADDLARARGLLVSVGKVVQLAESQLDAVTALSGSGPAYVFLLAEAMIDAGVLVGLARPVATELAIQTLVGSALMLRDSGDSPAQLREAVTSPGGTTAAALKRLEDHRFRAALGDALEAARDRSRELAGGA